MQWLSPRSNPSLQPTVSGITFCEATTTLTEAQVQELRESGIARLRNRPEWHRPAIALHYVPHYTRYEPARSHVMERSADVAPGEIPCGEHFPIACNDGPTVGAAAEPPSALQ